MLTAGDLFSTYLSYPHPFRFALRFSGVGKIDVSWNENRPSLLKHTFYGKLLTSVKYEAACRALHRKALNEAISQSKHEKSSRAEGGAGVTTILMKGQMDQVEADFKSRVEELALQDSISTRFVINKLH